MADRLANAGVQFVKGIGPRRATLLQKLGIDSLKDAAYYLPFRYEDRKNIKKIDTLRPDSGVTLSGKILSINSIKTPKSRTSIFELTISDSSSAIKAKWFNQPFMKKLFKKGQNIVITGTTKLNPYSPAMLELHNPEFELIDTGKDELIHTSRITPIYRTTSGLGVKLLRNIMFTLIERIVAHMHDPVPHEIIDYYKLPGLKESICNLHFPEGEIDVNKLNNGTSIYHNRLSFDELFYLELGLTKIKDNRTLDRGISFVEGGKYFSKLMRGLPFSLTNSQKRVLNEILKDMKSSAPMHRLIQGDVGSGKTIVALPAILNAIDNGRQTALMAPTELLAEQHFYNIKDILKGAGFDEGMEFCLLTGKRAEINSDSQGVVSIPDLKQSISKGGIMFTIGTHSLIQESVTFSNLGLIVIDEQHRFGVMQRAELRQKGANPDVLVMTATPIPRTLAMTLYGDLHYSVIDELPPNRTPVETIIVNDTQKKSVYDEIGKEILSGGQVYVVYPAIDENEESSLHSALKGKEGLERMFTNVKIGLLHGKMKTAEREEAMEDFKSRKTTILVSTTVIEVGIDVPEASLMIIVHAERFGLSQLHQLRGRVGRGVRKSRCILLAYTPLNEIAERRLSIMAETSDGFRISEEDLNIRGPGEFLGARQSGMPDLKTAHIIRDSKWLEIAKSEAERILSKDPDLKSYPLLKEELNNFWRGSIELFHG